MLDPKDYQHHPIWSYRPASDKESIVIQLETIHKEIVKIKEMLDFILTFDKPIEGSRIENEQS